MKGDKTRSECMGGCLADEWDGGGNTRTPHMTSPIPTQAINPNTTPMCTVSQHLLSYWSQTQTSVALARAWTHVGTQMNAYMGGHGADQHGPVMLVSIFAIFSAYVGCPIVTGITRAVESREGRARDDKVASGFDGDCFHKGGT